MSVNQKLGFWDVKFAFLFFGQTECLVTIVHLYSTFACVNYNYIYFYNISVLNVTESFRGDFPATINIFLQFLVSGFQHFSSVV